MTIQTGIDGYRLIADRTGKYAGNDDAQFEGSGEWPIRATVTAWKLVNNERCAFSASARWKEYYPGDGAPGFMWRKFPFLMLAKCAEAMALRKAFPAELSGIYTFEEMQQADEEPKEAPKLKPKKIEPPETPKTSEVLSLHDRIARIQHDLLDKVQDVTEIKRIISECLGEEKSSKEFTAEDCDKLNEWRYGS